VREGFGRICRYIVAMIETEREIYCGNVDGFGKWGTRGGLNFKVVLNQGWVKNEGPAGVELRVRG
jgi:hypothetical protein